MYVWRKLLFLLAVIHEASGTWVKGTGIKYFLATCGRQNCDTVCGTFGFQCARTGQSFPPTSALGIFESLGISCKSFNATDYYIYEDHPNYVAEAPGNKEWVGVCLGFKSIPSTIDCHTANNTYVRRLCPCYDSSVPQKPATTSLDLSTITKCTTTTTTPASTPADVTASSTTATLDLSIITKRTTTSTTPAATSADVTASSSTATLDLSTITKRTTTTTTTTTPASISADVTASSTTATSTAAATAVVVTTTTMMPHGTSTGTAKPPRTTTTTTTTETTTETTTSETEKTTSEIEVTTGIDNATDDEQSTGKDIGTGLPREQEATSGKAERTALIVVAVIAAGLVICLLSLGFLLMWKRKQLRGKRNNKQDSEKLGVGYHKNNNKIAVPDMIDGLTVVADIEEENSYCEMKSVGRSLQNTKDTKVKSLGEDESSNENTYEQASENILYSSFSEGTNMAFEADSNIPLYDRLA